MFKELFTENTEADKNNVYWDSNTSRWGIESDILRFGKRYGNLIAVFMTKENVRDRRDSERWCFDLTNSGEYKYSNVWENPGNGYIVCRYVTRTTLAGGMAPLVAINPKQGKVRFIKQGTLDGDPYEWDRPQKVAYMRVDKSKI
jgi:uncharacterized protein (DUF2237 family)